MTGRSGTLAFFAGLGQGYMQQEDKERAQKIQQEQIDFQNYQRDRQKTEDARNDKLRTDLQSAAAPAEVSTSTVAPGPDADNRDVGQPTYRVNGAQFDSQQAAGAAQATTDLPQAQMARMADVYARSGDPMQAASLRAQVRQSTLADLQLTKAQSEALKLKQWDDINARVKSADDLGDYISSTKGDGQGGALKAKSIVDPKTGAITIKQVNEDGTLGKQIGQSYKDLTEAKIALAGAMTPEMMISHQHQQALEDLERSKNASQERYQQGMLKNNADKVAMMGQVAEARAEAAAARTAATKKDPSMLLPPAASIQLKGLEKRADSLQGVVDKARADGNFDPVNNPQHKELLTDLAMLTQQQQDLYARYVPGFGKPGAVDPIGAIDRGAAPRAAPSGKAPPPILGDASGQFGAPDPRAVMAPPQAQVAPAAAAAPVDRVTALRAALAADDQVKSGGLFGMGTRAIRAGALPMGMAERADAERELAALTAGAR